VGEVGTAQRTPNLKSIVQEIVNQSNWNSGNSLVIIIKGTTGKRVAQAFEGSSVGAPLLHVEFSTSAVSSTFTPTPTAIKTATATTTAAPFTATPTATLQPTSTPATPVVTSTNVNSVDVRVASGNDDVEENSSGTMYINSSDLELVYDNSTQVVGLRFTGVKIPVGAAITNAYIQFKTDETSSQTINLTINGEANANASAFSNTAQNVSKRTRTSNSVTWSPSSWLIVGEVGTAQRTPNLKSIVQEIVNQSNWNSGNSLVVIITGTTGKRVAQAFEGYSAGAPLLHVEFSTPAQSQAAKVSLPTATPTATLMMLSASPTIAATFTPQPTQILSPTTAATEIIISTETPVPTPIPPSPTVEVIASTETPILPPTPTPNP
jgi:hypothetical protein